MRSRPVVAIDGPAGAGKTTVARGVARSLGYVLVDTGALYRAVALAAREAGIASTDHQALGELAQTLVSANRLRLEADRGEVPKVILDERVLGGEIRSAAISMDASTVSAAPRVRAALLDLQRAFGHAGGVVLEGRDIGTVVFPDAEVKVFLTASAEERASRRHREFSAQGNSPDFDRTLAEIRTRDKQDSERPVAPLRPASDAMLVDSSGITVEEVIEKIALLARAVEKSAAGSAH